MKRISRVKFTGSATMKSINSPTRSFVTIVLACLILAACSGLGESARLKSQAKQFMEEGRLAEAVLTYRQALISHPDDPYLLSGLGMALVAQGRDRSADWFLNKAASLKPADDSIRNTLAKLVKRPQEGLSLNLVWISDNQDSEPVGAVVEAGMIFVAYAEGRLRALDQGSGQTAGRLLFLIRLSRLLPRMPGRSGWVPKMDRFIYMTPDQARAWVATAPVEPYMLPRS
jgi:hypothetical protein